MNKMQVLINHPRRDKLWIEDDEILLWILWIKNAIENFL